jgi:hypothetical protein
MSRLVEEIRRKLSRVFLGRIIVRDLGYIRRAEPARIETHTRSVEVSPMRTEPRVNAAFFTAWRNSKVKSAGSVMSLAGLSRLGVERVELNTVRAPAVKQCKLNIKRRAEAKRSMWRINRAPAERRNRINFLKSPPRIEKATMLAIYSPIYQEKVAKSALDKSSGNLLFWYDNKRIKWGEKYHLLLLRVFGGEEPLKWVWLPADKKIG